MISANIKNLKFAGTLFETGDAKLIIPALSTGQVRENYQMILDVGAVCADEDTDSFEFGQKRIDQKVKLIQLAASRNYPDVTTDDILTLTDLDNLDTLLVAVLGRSMSPKVRLIEGEVQPVATKI